MMMGRSSVYGRINILAIILSSPNHFATVFAASPVIPKGIGQSYVSQSADGMTTLSTKGTELFFCDLSVSNDAAERCVMENTEYAEMARDSAHREDILLAVSVHWDVSQELKRDALAQIRL